MGRAAARISRSPGTKPTLALPRHLWSSPQLHIQIRNLCLTRHEFGMAGHGRDFFSAIVTLPM